MFLKVVDRLRGHDRELRELREKVAELQQQRIDDTRLIVRMDRQLSGILDAASEPAEPEWVRAMHAASLNLGAAATQAKPGEAEAQAPAWATELLQECLSWSDRTISSESNNTLVDAIWRARDAAGASK